MRETIQSIRRQTFTDFEHVVVDGGSTDNTLSILEQYRDIRTLSIPDKSVEEGLRRSIKLTRGQYIMFCNVSDGYLDPTWFQQCVDVLDNNPEISLVHGLHKVKRCDGKLTPIIYAELESHPPPQKMNFFPYWLATFFPFHEVTWCIRANIFKSLLPKANDRSYCGRLAPFMKFRYNFNRLGYLSYFLPAIACFTREHADSLNNGKYGGIKRKWTEKEHISSVIDYRRAVISGRTTHVFRDGNGRIIGSLGASQLADLQKKILEYRINRSNYFDYIDPLNKKCLLSKYGRQQDTTKREQLL